MKWRGDRESGNVEDQRGFGFPGGGRGMAIGGGVGGLILAVVVALLGTTAKVDAQRERVSETEANHLSVRLELQADFYAGVWAHHAQEMKHILEPGDIESALNAAHQIGDDYLEKRAQGRVVPDSFT